LYKEYKEKGYKELENLVLKNDYYAINELGERKFQERNYKEALEYFEKASKLGSDMAINNIGFYFLEIENNFEEAEKYFNKAIEKFLDEILSYKSEKFQNRTIGSILSENMIELMIEPGRSLLDDVGINIAQVTYTKLSANNDLMIGLDINRSNIILEDQEILIDPILISQNTKQEKDRLSLTVLP